VKVIIIIIIIIIRNDSEYDDNDIDDKCNDGCIDNDHCNNNNDVGLTHINSMSNELLFIL